MKSLITFLGIFVFLSLPTYAKNDFKVANNNSHTLVCSNVAGIQSNMVEFTGIFKGNLNKLENRGEIKRAYQQILNIGNYLRNQETQTLEQLIPKKLQQMLIKQLIIPWYKQSFPGEEMSKKAADSIELFYQTYGQSKLSNLLFAKQYANELVVNGQPFKSIKFGIIDKAFRTLGLVRYTITQNVVGKRTDFVLRGKTNQKKLLHKWIRSIKSAIANKVLIPKKNMIIKKNLLQDNAALEMFLTAAFDCYIWQQIAKRDLFDAVDLVRTTFYNSPLGDIHKKRKRLCDLYLKNKADIICLQEADKGIVQYLTKEKNYFSKDGGGNIDLSNGSRILLRKDKWDEEKTTSLQLTKAQLSSFLSTQTHCFICLCLQIGAPFEDSATMFSRVVSKNSN